MNTKPLFTDFGLDQDLADALDDRGIVHPFSIQELTLPLGFKGHDIIGQARTGTGKTLAFGLPLLQRIDASRNQTQAMVIVPTRELCQQVAEDLTVGADRGITSIAVYGGVGYEEQIEALTTGVHVVVGTPGRTIDHLDRGNLDVSHVHTVVLDEADEMLDMGFLPDVERLLVDVPGDRQTLLFSATMPTEIVKLARRFMDKPTFMRADETLHETDPNVDQHFFLVHRMDKPRVLARLLQMPDRGGAFVFCRTKRMCDRLVRELDDLGVNAIAVHGDLRQSSRERNMDKFRDGKADVLVATEVAARGLDVSNVTHVVNYDCPDDEKMYLHRIGRTARAGQSGVAVTFAQFNEVDRVNVIRKRVEADGEMTEIFSTSDELTELFDLPAHTPWDNLGTSDAASNATSGSSSEHRADSRSSSSGRSRSSGRGSDRRNDAGSSSRRRSQRSTSKARDQRRESRQDSSRNRSRTRSATAPESLVAEARESRDDSGNGQGSAKDRDTSPGKGRERHGDSRDSADRRNTTSRRRSASRDRNHEQRDTAKSSRTDGTRDGQARDGGDTQPRRTTGGARPRSRRNRGKSDAKSGGTRSENTKAGPTTSRSAGSESGGSGDSGGSGSERSGSGRSRRERHSASSGRSDGDRNRRDRDDRGRHDGGGGPKGSAPTTTRRGDDARGTGSPRPRRRVEVEHLP